MTPSGSLARRRLLDRRTWLALVGVATSSLACRSRSSPGTPTTHDAGVDATAVDAYAVLSAAEAVAIEALTARILPSDDGPGAREAKVVRFVDRQLQTPEMSPLAPAVQTIARLLDRIDGRPFAALPLARQDELAQSLSQGGIAIDPPFPQREVFRLLHMLTLEGFLSDPIHGGNDGMVGWRSIGFAAPTLRAKGAVDAHQHVHLPVVDAGGD